MKKYLILILFITLAIPGFCQSASFGIKGGFNSSSQNISNDRYDLNYQSIQGFNAGVVADVDFGKFSLQPSVSYTTKGVSVPAQQLKDPTAVPVGYVVPESKTRLNYVELSVPVLYNVHIIPLMEIQLGGGPYLADGVSGNKNSQKVSFSNDDPPAYLQYKNPDYGINFIAGVKINKSILFNCSFDLGLANLGFDGETVKNNVVSVSVGYLFK